MGVEINETAKEGKKKGGGWENENGAKQERTREEKRGVKGKGKEGVNKWEKGEVHQREKCKPE